MTEFICFGACYRIEYTGVESSFNGQYYVAKQDGCKFILVHKGGGGGGEVYSVQEQR